MVDSCEFKLSLLFERDRDVSGLWNASILELDGVTSAPSLRDVCELAIDMAVTLLADDVENGRDPYRVPDPEASRRYSQIFHGGTFVSGSMSDIADHEAALDAVAAVALVTLHVSSPPIVQPAPFATVRPVAEAPMACA